jgi:uncharacterized protein
MTNNARRGRELNEEVGGRCATDVGKETARILANRETLSDDRVVRMFSFLSRAETYYDESDPKACGTISYLLWGGKAAKRWSEARVKEMQERELSSTAKTALENKVEKHNEEVEAQFKKANLRMLEQVYNRGIGAYETNPESVRPQVTSAEQWAMARVNSFLYALKNERFRGGKHDTDLFPEGHPLRSDNEDERAMELQQEERTEPVQLEKQTRTMEVRAAKPMVLEGYAAVFDEETDLGAFREKIAPGAFDDVLDNDVRLLVDHNPPPLARTTNGTLQLSVDERGLKYRAELVDTQAARDLYEMVKRGDINQSSFAFTIAEQDYDSEKELRTVTKVAQLFDVAPVTYPAYAQTDVAARKKETDKPKDVTCEAVEATEVVTRKKESVAPPIIRHMNFKTSTDAQHHIHSLESKLESIQNVASSEERALTADELSETQEIHSKLEMAEEQRDALAKNEARIKRMAQTGAPSVSEEKELAKVGGEFNLLRAMSCAANGRNLDGAEAEMLAEAQKEAASMGLAMRGNVALPQSYLQLRNTYGNDANLSDVATAVSSTSLEAAAVREALRPRAVIESVGATQLTGFVGDIKLPTLPNDAASTPDEGAAATAFSGAMNSVTLTPQRYAAQITVTKEALNQATGNMQQVIARDFGNAIGAQIDRVAFKNMIDQGGTLSGGTLTLGATPHDSRAQSEATIVLATEGSNANDLAQMTANDVANLWAEITGNGVSEGAFVMHPKTAGYLFNVNTTGAGGAPVLANNQIYGYPVVTTGTMPRLNIDAAHSDGFVAEAAADTAFGSGADVVGALLYGDFSNVFWATWGGLSLTIDPFTGLSSGLVKVVADQFFDVKLRTPGHMGLMLANDTGADVAGA